MIKDNQQHFNRLHVLIDAFVIAGSYMLSWAIQFQILKKTTGLTFGQYMIILLLIVPIYLLLYMAFSLYTTKSVRRKRVELDKIIEANTIGLVLLLAGLYLFRSAQDIWDFPAAASSLPLWERKRRPASAVMHRIGGRSCGGGLRSM